MKFGGVSIDLLVLYVGDDDGSYQADSLQPAGDCTYTVYFPPGNATRPPWSVQDVRLSFKRTSRGVVNHSASKAMSLRINPA